MKEKHPKWEGIWCWCWVILGAVWGGLLWAGYLT